MNMAMNGEVEPCAVILGGYVNGYSIIRELHECGVSDIWLLDYGKSMSRYSKYLTGFGRIDKTSDSLKACLENLRKRFGKLVLFPTDDLQLELLLEIFDDISSFCFLPFNEDNLMTSLDKSVQYEFCERLGIPYPKTCSIRSAKDYVKILELKFPIIIKPSKRADLTQSVFRSMFLESEDQLHDKEAVLSGYIERGVEFLASEFIPGDDTRIFAYVGYRSRTGSILNEWIGKKLTQYPDRFGVFSSASNEAPQVIKEQGRALLESMDLVGISEPEFKFDERDGKYKLMEINLRSMMWHRTGNRCGVRLQYSQWLDALGMTVPTQQQLMSPRIHFVYMKHELINLLSRKGYWDRFKHNIFGGDKTCFAVFDRGDLKPFFYDTFQLLRIMVSQWLKMLFSR